MSTLKETLRAEAVAIGFAKIGICRPSDIPQAGERLRSFVATGYHGQMGWLEERIDWRADPSALWPEARSVIMLADLYTPEEDPLAVLQQRDRAAISVYAQNKDYHDVVKKRLKRLGRWMLDHGGPTDQIKVFVDTAPVMEKPLAQAAGLGWQGKHTNLLARDLGNFFFLGAIFTTLDLEPDSAEVSHCGTCTACLDICPTQAFPAPYQLDARRCISYLTIEHKGPIEPALRPALGNRIYGCDDCLAICPWNKFAKSASDIRYAGRDDLRAPNLGELVTLDDTQFRTKFSGSPIKRIGRDRFVRNVLYAIGNSGDAELIEQARALVDDPDATVADAAKWALEQIK